MAAFSQSELAAIAGALGDTTDGLTGTEIEFLFRTAKLFDSGPMTKRDRIYNAFVHSQNSTQKRNNVLAFIRKAMEPARYSRTPGRYEPMRANLNRALAFAGLVVDESGILSSVSRAT